MGDETPAAALVLLDPVIAHPATLQTTRRTQQRRFAA